MTDLVYAIGDIHGHIDKLSDAHLRISQDRVNCGDNGATVIHVGDLVDRGPDSKGVIDFILAGLQAGQPWVVLKGNHDRLLQKFLEDPNWRDPVLRPDYTWLHPNMGGRKTLQSYGVDASEDRSIDEMHQQAVDLVPASHQAFLATMPLYHETMNCLFVHAGIRPNIAIEAQSENDLMWIRDDFLSYTQPHNKLVVHGHTMVKSPTRYTNRVNIDSGAGRGDDLSAIVIEDQDVWVLESDGRRKLTSLA